MVWPFKQKQAPTEKKAGSFSDMFTLYMSGSGNVFLFTNYALQEIINNYTQVSPLNGAITKISEAIGQLPFGLKEKKSGKIIDQHPVLDLLRHPNNTIQTTQRDFFRDIAIWKILEGDAFIVATGAINKPPVELVVVNPSEIIVNADQRGWIQSINYGINRTSQEYVYNPVVNKFVNNDKTGEMLFIRGFNPNYSITNLTGMSEVSSVYYEVNQYLAAGQHNLGLLKNGARPSGALVLKTKDGNPIFLNEESFARIKAQMEENYSGAMNSGKPMLLEGGLEWEEMSVNPKDMDFLNMEKYAEQQIYKRFGIPVQLISAESATYNNMQEARLEFYENKILPMTEDLLDNLTPKLLSRYGLDKTHELTVDKDAIDVFTVKKNMRRDSIEKSTVLMLNEKRSELGLKPVKLGNNVFYQDKIIAGEDAESGAEVRAAMESSQAKIPPVGGQQDPNNPTPPNKQGKGIVETVPFLYTKNMFVPEVLDDPILNTHISSVTDAMYFDLVMQYGQDVVDEIAKNLVFQQTTYMEQFIRSSSADLISNINATTKKRIRQQLLESAQAGEDITGITTRLNTIFDDPTRVDTIAMTETTKAAGFANREALDQAGIDKGVWLTVKDGHARDAHRAMDGQVSDNGGYFTAPDGHRTRHPGGFGVARLDINCRCAVVGYFGQDGDKGFTQEYLTKEWLRKEEKRVSKEDIVKTAMRKVFTLQKDTVILELN